MPVRNDRLVVHGSRLGRPGPGEEMPSDGVELADLAPAEAAQERAEGRRRLDREAEDPGRAARSESPGVVDAFTARERRHDEREQLVTARERRHDEREQLVSARERRHDGREQLVPPASAAMTSVSSLSPPRAPP